MFHKLSSNVVIFLYMRVINLVTNRRQKHKRAPLKGVGYGRGYQLSKTMGNATYYITIIPTNLRFRNTH